MLRASIWRWEWRLIGPGIGRAKIRQVQVEFLQEISARLHLFKLYFKLDTAHRDFAHAHPDDASLGLRATSTGHLPCLILTPRIPPPPATLPGAASWACLATLAVHHTPLSLSTISKLARRRLFLASNLASCNRPATLLSAAPLSCASQAPPTVQELAALPDPECGRAAHHPFSWSCPTGE